MLTNLLCPTDFSEASERAVRQAAHLASRHGARMHLFHAVSIAELGDGPEEVKEERLEDVRARLRAIARELPAHDVRTVERAPTPLSAAEAILSVAESLGPDLIVMGTEGRTGAARLLMGSIAGRVLRDGRFDVMTLRSGAAVVEEPFERVLVPVEFSELSRRALRAAKALAESSTEIFVLHVLEPPIRASAAQGGGAPDDAADLREQLLSDLEHFAGGESANLEVLIASESAAGEILRKVEERRAQLIVMGTRGLAGLDRFLLGSIADRVVSEAPVPVVTVK